MQADALRISVKGAIFAAAKRDAPDQFQRLFGRNHIAMLRRVGGH
ncbi:hypothetical protein [Rhizobium sp. BR 362]